MTFPKRKTDGSINFFFVRRDDILSRFCGPFVGVHNICGSDSCWEEIKIFSSNNVKKEKGRRQTALTGNSLSPFFFSLSVRD